MANKKARKQYEKDAELYQLAVRLQRKEKDINRKIRSLQDDLKSIQVILHRLSKWKDTFFGCSIKEILQDYLDKWDEFALSIVPLYLNNCK